MPPESSPTLSPDRRLWSASTPANAPAGVALAGIALAVGMLLILSSASWTIPIHAEEKGGNEVAAEAAGGVEVRVEEWLGVGPWPIRLPAFAEESYGTSEWLAEADFDADDLHPADGRAVTIPAFSAAESSAAWSRLSAEDGAVRLEAPGEGSAHTAWLATYIEVDRFTEAKLELEGTGAARVLLDGVEVATLEEAAEAAEASGEEELEEGASTTDSPSTEAELVLETGRHLLLVETASHRATWTLGATVRVDGANGVDLELGLDPERGVSLGDLLDSPRPGGLRLSPDGGLLAIAHRQPAVPAEHVERWIELVDTDSGDVVRTLRGGEGNFAWSPEGDAYVYTAQGAKGRDIFLARTGSGEIETLARGIENLSNLRFLPDGSALILTLDEPSEPDDRGVKRYRDLADRWSTWRSRSHLHLLRLDGTRIRLTVGDQEDALLDISADSRRLLLMRPQRGSTERPFIRNHVVEIELATLESRTLLDLEWVDSVRYSPDGERLLVIGSPALFDGAGNPLPEGTIANDYDGQAYLYTLESGEVEAISRDFDPAIVGGEWSSRDGAIYFRAIRGAGFVVTRYDPETKTYRELSTGVDVASGVDQARAADKLAYVGESPNRPPAVYVLGTADGATPKRLADPVAETIGDVRFGEVKDWNFVSSGGDEITGRVYYPPNFDPEARYPLIVYYYGGTVPTSRSFGGRYPKELWAANGYLVYVLQPSGTNGFGAEFAARHVNAWGRRTADEIIEGTKQFLDAHPYADPERVGCTGASYGGFMTMYLQTRTDIYSAAISHAGISNLASYWGKGWWGYLYSAAASANSYPWNNRQLYIDQSPLYAADRIETPLLLLHGDADTNVPPTESHQMYTALRVLGKEVELIEIGGENHTILTYDKRLLWSKTILAWFDRYLKSQPAAWEHLWGTEEAPKG